MGLTQEAETARISSPRLLAVEGRDEEVLFRHLATRIGVEGLVVEAFGGTGGVTGYLRGLRVRAGFRRLRILVVVRDADLNCDRAFQSVTDALRRQGFAAPDKPGAYADGQPRVGVLIMPCGAQQGSIEDACLASARDLAALSCVEGYVRCLTDAEVQLHPNPGKVRVHAYLASREEPGLKIGEAAKAKHWNFDHEVWAAVKQFLLEM